MLTVDNLMDLTHLGYLHAKTVGGNAAAHVEAEMKTTRTPTSVKFPKSSQRRIAENRQNFDWVKNMRRG
jgi:hypothetical protein